MSSTNIELEEFKRILKAAIGEALKERCECVRDIIDEALEGIGLQRAVEEDLESPPVSRDDVSAVCKDCV